MASVVGHYNGITRKKRKLTVLTLLHLTSALILFFIRPHSVQRVQYFLTFIMVILLLGTGFYGLKLFMYMPYKDGKEEMLNKLKKLPENLVITCGVLLNNESMKLCFDYVLVSDQHIYFLRLESDPKSVQRDQVIKFIEDLVKGREMGLKPILVDSQALFDKYYKKLESEEIKKTTASERAVNLMKLLAM